MVYSSYFSMAKKLHELGIKTVSISRSTPEWYVGLHAESLAPSWTLVVKFKEGRISEEEYEKVYREEVLSKLIPAEVYKTLDGAAILCWEGKASFCHRHIVIKWLNENGFQAQEYTF